MVVNPNPPPLARAVYVADGDELDYIPTADVVAGQVVVQGNLVGVVQHAAPAGERTSLETIGLYDFPKPVGVTNSVLIAGGRPVYWDEVNQVVTADDAGGVNKALGKTAQDVLDSDPFARVRMWQ